MAIFFADRGDVVVLKTRDKIAQLDGLALLAIRSNKRRKSRERAHLANAGDFRYRRFYTPIAAISENGNGCIGHTWRFLPVAAIDV